MNEVISNNFEELYPEIENALKNACFISIDSEFTGLTSKDNIRESLFDTSEERYGKLRAAIEPLIAIQFGITAFQRIRSKNAYQARAYTFYLLPKSIPGRNRCFVWQALAIEFLSSHDFDFNKVAYDSISYLNEPDKALLQQQLNNKTLYTNIERAYKEEDDLKDHINKVTHWLKETKESLEESMIIQTPTPMLKYLTHKELRNRFSNIWTLSGEKLITVIKVTKEMRTILEQEDGQVLEDVLLDSYLGFSRVINLLASLKIPIIGHNLFLDLMFIYKQFYWQLPKEYKDFKRKIHQLFPIIYDTKYLSYELLNMLPKKDRWKTNSLIGLYTYFKEGNGKQLIFNPPLIELCGTDNLDTERNHHAGWDAFFAGYAYIRMIFIFAVRNYGKGTEQRSLTQTELTNSVKHHSNCINLIRAGVSHVKLDGEDPKSRRPEWLFVKSLGSKGSTQVNIESILSNVILTIQTSPLFQIAEEFSTFGTIDVKPFTSRKFLVAVANHGSARDILRHFQYNKELSVVPYNPLRHSSPVKLVLWGSIFLSGSLFAWMVHRTIQK